MLKEEDKQEREGTVAARVDANSVPPRRFKAVMGRRFADFATSQQQDASYFFGHFLDLLEGEERGVAARLAGEEAPPCSRLFMWSLEQRVQVRCSCWWTCACAALFSAYCIELMAIELMAIGHRACGTFTL